MDNPGRSLLVLLVVHLIGVTLSDDATTVTLEPEVMTTQKSSPDSMEFTESVTEIELITDTLADGVAYSDSNASPSTVSTPTDDVTISGRELTTMIATGDVDPVGTAVGSTLGTEMSPGRAFSSLDATEAPDIGSTSLSSGSISNDSVTVHGFTTTAGGSSSTSTSPSLSPTNSNPNDPRFVSPRRKNFTMTLKMSGNCKEVTDKDKFLTYLGERLTDHLGNVYQQEVFKLFPLEMWCGSVYVRLMVEMPLSAKETFDVNEDFTFSYENVMYRSEEISFVDRPRVTTPGVIDVDNATARPSPLQETLIYIVIGSVGGSFVLLSLFLLCQYLAHKAIKTSRKSTYRPSGNPSAIKLSDFNMAHTYIPRPQSIYSATTRSSFLPYEDMDPGSYGGVVSPTPYVYADGDQIREHYQEVVEKGDPLTPTTKTINDFGRSGIPNWDLPILEGVVHEEDSASALRIDDRPTSSTFHAPPEVIPPPPDSNPPPPPSESGSPTPPKPAEESTTSIKSEDGSSHTELSGGDTRHLIQAQNHDVGVDNPALDIDSAYF